MSSSHPPCSLHHLGNENGTVLTLFAAVGNREDDAVRRDHPAVKLIDEIYSPEVAAITALRVLRPVMVLAAPNSLQLRQSSV